MPEAEKPAADPPTTRNSQAGDLAPPDARNQQASGTSPRRGLWRGKVSNQGGDQTITFLVSADGSTVSEITFVGYWRCPKAMNPTQSTRLAPPNKVAVSGGAFSTTQNDKPSRTWYQFIGDFTSATAATGSIRIAYAGGECDTYKLQWTAQHASE